MSNNFWQTIRQPTQFKSGRHLTERVREYELVWENRCYENGISDEVPEKIAKSGRAPSYKALVIAILKNDHQLKSLGFTPKESSLCRQLRQNLKDSQQLKLF